MVTDEVLVHGIVSGNGLAEIQLYEKYQESLVRFLRPICRSESDAEDISQEVFRILLEKLRQGDLRDASKLQAFIFQTGRFQVIGYYRKRSRMVYTEFTDDIPAPRDVEATMQQ